MREIKTVLCPMDLSAISDREVELASQICLRFGARLVLQHNLDRVPPIYLANVWMYSETHMYPEEEQQAKAERRFQEIFSKLPKTIPVEGKITQGHLEDTILELAYQLPADLIVMGTHDRRGSEHISHTDRMLLQSPCPILTLREAESQKVTLRLAGPDEQTVLVPMDFSRHSLHTLEYALSLLEPLPIRLHLLHVVRPISWGDIPGLTHLNVTDRRRRHVEEAQKRLESLIPVNLSGRARAEIAVGSSVQEIIGCANRVQATMIIMGVHPKGAIDKWLFGATSCGVLHHSSCPVWIVPPVKSMHESSWTKARAATAMHDANSSEHGPDYYVG